MFGTKDQATEPRFDQFDTLIGQATRIEGSVRTTEPLRIDGQVQGEVTSETDLVVGETGSVTGDIRCGNMLLAGTVEGNVTASGQLHITSRGTLRGDANIRTFILDEAGTFEGHCRMQKEDPLPDKPERGSEKKNS